MAVDGAILGIDPGSVKLGYGVIAPQGNKLIHISHGTIPVNGADLPQKLGFIYQSIAELLQTFSPVEVAVEDVFVAKNAMSALKLGQARGAAICPAVLNGLPVSSYAPRLVKRMAAGSGAADKKQIQKMMKILFQLDAEPQEDAADGLAIAVCHANHKGIAEATGVAQGRRTILARRRKSPRRKSI